MSLQANVRHQCLSIIFLCFFALACKKEQPPSVCETIDGPLPEEMVIIRAQPSVFKINVVGDTEIAYPKTIRFRVQAAPDPLTQPWRPRAKMTTLLDIDHDHDLVNGLTTAAEKVSDYYWRKAAENPSRYLAVDDEDTVSLKDVGYATASGFAVGEDGILLTNAHVVADTDLGQPPEYLLEHLREPLNRFGEQLEKGFGGAYSSAVEKQIGPPLVEWFRSNCKARMRFKEAHVVVKSERDTWKMRGEEFWALVAPRMRETTVTAKVLAKGEPLPGKDVAVLQVSLKNKLISLPMGDSDDLLAGTRIRALGFPVSAYAAGQMHPEAAYRVTSLDGLVGQRKPMIGGWDYFEMTALIGPGASGGPVVDKEGNVIALNVGGPSGQVTGETLAVPMNLAAEYLKTAGVTPRPGALTALWVDGLKLYSKGCYAAAERKFSEVLSQQREDRETPVDTSYVEEMLRRSGAKRSKGSEKRAAL